MLVQPTGLIESPACHEVRRDRISGAPGDEIGDTRLEPVWQTGADVFASLGLWIEKLEHPSCAGVGSGSVNRFDFIGLER